MNLEELTMIVTKERMTKQLQPLPPDFFGDVKDLLSSLDSVAIWPAPFEGDNFELKSAKTKIIGLLHRRIGKIMQRAIVRQKRPDYLTEEEKELWQKVEDAMTAYEVAMVTKIGD